MSEHTPGPWKVSSKASTAVFAGDRLIASAGGYMSNTRQESVVIENDANARLIAAAPDLLAACETALVMIQVLGGDYMAGFEKIEAAVSKAKGG